MKYLIVRPDGLLPAYPVFVLDAHDPAATKAMLKYAYMAHSMGYSNHDELFALAQRFAAFAGTPPPPLINEDEYIVRALNKPGGRVKLYEMNSTPHI